MNRGLLVMAVITIALAAYALTTAQIPPASIEYREVFYMSNQSVTFVTKDGFGLFSMVIHPRVDSFDLTITFPEGTEYMVRYGEEIYKGEGMFKITVKKDSLPDEVYVQFQLPKEVTERIVQQGEEAQITISGDKLPVWHAKDVIYIRYRKEANSKG